MESHDSRDSALAPEAAIDEPASPVNPEPAAAAGPPPAEPRLFVDPLISDCLGETFLPDARKPRHDGWTPERVGGFLRNLASCGVVQDAAKSVGLSAQAAYAYRNRREGRAFAKVWDAILIHRARARLAGDNLSRSLNGCIEAIHKDGAVVAERHRYDNRLSMAMLTRLDRLAEKEAPSEEHLRALSEDLDEFIDCVSSGGDVDAFVEARRPAPPAEPVPAARPEPRDDFDRLASLTGGSNYREVHPFDIDISDLDPARRDEWDADQWIRAERSGFLFWLGVREQSREPVELAPETAAYIRRCGFARVKAAMEEARQAGAEAVEVGDLHPDGMPEWSADQWERAESSGLLAAVPVEAWKGQLHPPEDAGRGGDGEPPPPPGRQAGEAP